MLGFAFANPNAILIIQRWGLFVSEIIRNDSTPELEAVGKFLKRQAKDPRRKVLWIDKLTTLHRIQQDWPAEKMAEVLIGVFDVGDLLAEEPNVKIVDAVPEVKAGMVKPLWRMHRYDLEAVMTAATPGYGPSAPAPKVAKVKAAAKTVQPSAPIKLTAVKTAVTPDKPAKLPQDSLPQLFDPMLASIENESKRQKAGSWIANRLQNTLSKEEWLKRLAVIEKYGVDAELIRAALRAYKNAGHVGPLRSAIRAVVADKVDLETAAQVAETRLFDLKWVDKHWALSNLTPESIGA